MTYSKIDQLSWEEILLATVPEYRLPLTVHLPIQPAQSPDLLQIEPSLNVARRRIFPKLSTRDIQTWQAANEAETFVLQFALDDPPFVPDFRLTRMSITPDALPIAHAEHFAYDLVYGFEYFSVAIRPGQTLLWVGVTITNTSQKPLPAHVRARLTFAPENKLFPYHYVPYYWDANNWIESDAATLDGNHLMRGGQTIGKILPNDFTATWEPLVDSSKAKYNARFDCGEPYSVPPAMQLHHLNNVTHFRAELAPGESKSFRMAILVNDTDAKADAAALQSADYARDRDLATTHFRSIASEGGAELIFPAANWDRIFNMLQISSRQLMIEFPGEQSLMGTQGGSSERHFVWIWEVMAMVSPLLSLGHFAPAKRAIDHVFSLQDGGYPPEGKFTSLDGAIGTTGPRWANATGAAIGLAVTYYRLSRDTEFLKSYLPRLLRAADWIVREIRATRKLNADGSRPLTFGLMPHACATDGDIGFVYTVTDAWSFWGMEKLAALLTSIDHPRAAEIARETNTYRDDITVTAKGLQRADGFIERRVPVGGDEVHYVKFDNAVTASNLGYTNAMDPACKEFLRYADYFEHHQADGLFAAPMDRDVAYIIVGEWLWHRIYLRLGQYKKAFAALRTSMIYGMTNDTFQVQERFSKSNAGFCPWQPNGSGNGRILEMMLDAIYFEENDQATLLAGVPWLWLKQNQFTALRNLRTPRGKITLEARMEGADRCRVRLKSDRAGVLPQRVRLPDHLAMQEDHLLPDRIDTAKMSVEFLLRRGHS